LYTYLELLLPEQDHTLSIKRLTPLIQDTSIADKISKAADQKPSSTSTPDPVIMEDDEPIAKLKNARDRILTKERGDDSVLSQVVGVIIGSPAYQRR
jgi:hypothetical protein